MSVTVIITEGTLGRCRWNGHSSFLLFPESGVKVVNEVLSVEDAVDTERTLPSQAENLSRETAGSFSQWLSAVGRKALRGPWKGFQKGWGGYMGPGKRAGQYAWSIVSNQETGLEMKERAMLGRKGLNRNHSKAFSLSWDCLEGAKRWIAWTGKITDSRL